MAVSVALRGFNDLARSVTLFFFRWFIFSIDFLRFAKK